MIPGIEASRGALGGGGIPATIVRTDTSSNSNDQSSYTFTSQSLGTPAPGRKIIVTVGCQSSGSAYTYDDVQVGGVSATQVITTSGGFPSNQTQTAIYIIDNANDASATVLVDMSTGVHNCVIMVYAAYDLQSSIATDTAIDGNTNADLMNGDLNIQAGGIAVGRGTTGGNGQLATWAGLSEDDDEDVDGNSSSCASLASATGHSPLAVTCEFTGSNHSTLATASFR